jgi:quercetin dioxygenase-like cupin family protein
MALPHAQPLDVIDLQPLGTALRESVTTSLLKEPPIQLIRLVLRAGEGMPQHHVDSAITLLCIEGQAEVGTPERQCRLKAGELVMIEGGQPHTVRALTDTSLLLTILLDKVGGGPDPG